MICQYSLCLLIDHFKERVIFATSYCIFGLGILLYTVYYFAGLFNAVVKAKFLCYSQPIKILSSVKRLFFLDFLLLFSTLLHSFLKPKPKGYPTRQCHRKRPGTLTLLTLQEDVPQHVLLVHRPTAVAHVGHCLPHQPDAHNIQLINAHVTQHTCLMHAMYSSSTHRSHTPAWHIQCTDHHYLT